MDRPTLAHCSACEGTMAAPYLCQVELQAQHKFAAAKNKQGRLGALDTGRRLICRRQALFKVAWARSVERNIAGAASQERFA